MACARGKAAVGERLKTAAHYAHVDWMTYNGCASLMVDILDSQVQGGFATIAETLPHIKLGESSC